ASATRTMLAGVSASAATSLDGELAMSVYMRTGSEYSPGGAISAVAPSSPNEKMKATTQTAATAVRICGKTILRNARGQLAPETIAASSDETGTWRTLGTRMIAATGMNLAR